MSESDGPPRRYRNPPIEHRFRKGVSGNPRGRPRKTRELVSTKIDGKPGIGPEDRIKSLAIEEAYRLVNVREGDRVERIPLIQAIIRKVGVAAASGNTRAQQNFLNLLIGAEADRRMATMEVLKAAVEYKEHWGHVLAERARSGTTGPDPVPHPDDVIIDEDTFEVRFEGPVTEEQKAAQEWLHANSAKFERDLIEINKRIESEPNDFDLPRQKKKLIKVVRGIREDNLKRVTRDALRMPPKS